MRATRVIKNENKLIHKLLYTFLLILITSTADAQAPANLTGNWILDKAKSKLGETEASYPGTRILHITQNSSTIKLNETYKMTGAADYDTSADSFTLDGKEKIQKNHDYIEKISATFSADKKVIIVNMTGALTTNESDKYISTYSYNLSGDGQTLTVGVYMKSKAAGEIKSTIVYSKMK